MMRGRNVVVCLVAACPFVGAACSAGPVGTVQPNDAGSSDATSRPPTGSDAGLDSGGNAPTDAGGKADAISPAPDAGPACIPVTPFDASAITAPSMTNLVPLPVTVTPAGGAFVLPSTATIRVAPATSEMLAIADYLAGKLRPSTGYALPTAAAGATPCAGDILLTTTGADASLGAEGYDLSIDGGGVRISAPNPAGVFHGLQTLRQLFPASIESQTVSPGPFALSTGTIHDLPRYAWRGTMLDIARHFFDLADVERYVDLLAYYKLNTFHIHLSDDQGWRIVVSTYPNLTMYGGSTEVDGGPGGYYTQSDYSALVAYASARYITVVPEIDMPGHTTAALASYAQLNCNGTSPPLFTGTGIVGNSLCVSSQATYSFVSDVVSEVAAITPGSYFHVGGDEATGTSAADFQTFFGQVIPFVQTAGKQIVGWDALGQLSSLPAGTVVQYWTSGDTSFVTQAIAHNAKVLMSPADKAYMDMKYDTSTTLGQIWAGYINEQTGYSWDPATEVAGVGDAQIVGLEAPLWSETLLTLADVEYMAFPRLAGYAEIGWSPATGRSWDEYKVRLGSEGPRLRELGVNYHSSSLVPWE